MKRTLFLIVAILLSIKGAEGKVVHLRPGVELPVTLSPSMQSVLSNSSVTISGFNWSTTNSKISVRSQSKDACVLYTSSMLNGGEATLKYWVIYLAGYRSEKYEDSWTIKVSPRGEKIIWGDLQDEDYFHDYTEEDHLMLFYVTTGRAVVTSYRNGSPCISKSVKGKVTIPEYPQGYPVSHIYEDSFNNLSEITDLVLPSTLKTVDYKFIYGCSKLQTLTCQAKTPPSIVMGKSFDSSLRANTILIVPKGCKNQYKEAKGWKEFSRIKEIGEPIMNVQIDESNFPDKNFRSYLLSLAAGKDGVLSEVEIGRIEEVNVNEMNISSLKGIELFTDLETLKCSNNQLTSLDVSKNTNLKDLFCQYNNLTSLMIGDNEKLEYVWCYKNDLTSLDLSKCINLKSFDCCNNKLSSVSIAKNTCSKNLACYNNQIKGKVMDDLIDHLYDNSKGSKINLYLLTINDGNVCTKVQVDRIKAKGWIPVREIGYRGSHDWVELFVDDFINPTNFPDDEFRRCLFSQGIFSEQDVKKTKKLWVDNENITSIKGIEYFTALEELDCSYNQLTSLDLSKNSLLKSLDVKHNQIKGKPMNALIASLPIRPDNDGKFYAYSYSSSNRDENWITNTQVAASEIKGWKVYIDSTPYGSIYFKPKTGDVDDDGVIDEDDIKIVVQCIMGKQEDGVDLNKADVNRDKKVNAADIVEIVKTIRWTGH